MTPSHKSEREIAIEVITKILGIKDDALFPTAAHEIVTEALTLARSEGMRLGMERAVEIAHEKYLYANAADTMSQHDKGMSTASYEIESEVAEAIKKEMEGL